MAENYTHFAVNKKTGLIVNGWDYNGYDPEELRTYKKDYFINDLIDYEFDPKDYVILTRNTCIRRGINPDDMENCWSNRGELPSSQERSVKMNESNIRQMVEESVKRILFESESYGWEVDESEVSSAYDYLCNEIGEQEANAAIVRSMGSDALAASLAYIFRMYDMSGWKEYKTGELNEGVENGDYDPNMPAIIVGGKLEGEYTIGEIVEKFPISGYRAGSENPDLKIKTAGYPKIEGYIGPMWDGGRIRYESPDAYDLFSM